jgi:hypothetical protein
MTHIKTYSRVFSLLTILALLSCIIFMSGAVAHAQGNGNGNRNGNGNGRGNDREEVRPADKDDNDDEEDEFSTFESFRNLFRRDNAEENREEADVEEDEQENEEEERIENEDEETEDENNAPAARATRRTPANTGGMSLRNMNSIIGSVDSFIFGTVYDKPEKLSTLQTGVLLGSGILLLISGILLVTGRAAVRGWRIHSITNLNTQSQS